MEVTNNLIYNSQRELLTIPEYGRNVQKLITYCKTIEDSEKRQNVAEEIIDLMSRMSNSNKGTVEFETKLWKHFFRIAKFDIDVKPPEGMLIDKEDENFKPELPEYPIHNTSFRHYGILIQNMVKKALGMEDGPLKDQFIEIIGSYMKLAYRTWNREHYVSDEIIKEDLKAMTNGEIIVGEETRLNFLKASFAPQQNTARKKGKGGRSGNGHSRRNSNNKQRRRR
jgi:hypothetical protein